MEGQIQLSVILEVDYRRFLEREYRGTRRGGKLSRADREAIEQKILMARLPQRPSSPPPAELSHKEPASSSEISASSSQQNTESNDGVDLAASAANLQ